MVTPIDYIDNLQIYKGNDYHINSFLTIRQPTLGEITDYGEQKYYNMVYFLCSVGADLKWQLDDVGIDYSKIEDYDLFLGFLCHKFPKEQTTIILGETLDFSKMALAVNSETQEKVLIQEIDEGEPIVFDRYCYKCMVAALRTMHGIKRNDEVPGNESTRLILIEDARDEYEMNKDKPFKSTLLPMISTMVNSAGFKHDEVEVFNMKICPFIDSIKRIPKIKHADVLTQSAYSGFGIDIKKIDKNELNYMGELTD